MSENMEWKQTGEDRKDGEPAEEELRKDGEPAEEELRKDGEPAEEELRLEDILAQVEYCIEQLENPQISLEDSFRFYEEGIRRLKACNEKVEQIERKMLVIGSQGQLEEF